MASTATKLLETARQAVKGECSHSFAYEGPRCPCSAEIVLINAGTSNVRLLHGQRIFFCDEACKSRFVADPNSYFVTEGEYAAQQAAGSQPHGDWLDKKDYEHFQVWCPGCNTSLHVDGATPRVHLLNGQTLFFRCYECVVNFLKKPERFFATCGQCSDFKTKEQSTTTQAPSEQMQGLSISGQTPGQQIPEKSPSCTSCQGGRLTRQGEICSQCQCPPAQMQGQQLPAKSPLCTTCQGGRLSKQGETCPQCQCPPTQMQGLSPSDQTYGQQLPAKSPSCTNCQGGRLFKQGETCPQCQCPPKQEQKFGGLKEGLSNLISGKQHGEKSEHCHEWTEEKLELCQRKHHHSFKPFEKAFLKQEGEGKTLCPGCGMQVHFAHKSGTEIFVEFLGGQRIFFCSEQCRSALSDDPIRLLKSAKSFRAKEAEFLNLEGFIMICPTCQGSKMSLTTATPRIFFEHGQSLFFCKHDCLETFCASSKSYLHTCHRVHQARKQAEDQHYQRLSGQQHHYTTAMPVSGSQKVPLQQYPPPAPIQQETIQSVPVQQQLAQAPVEEHHGGGGFLSNIGEKLGLTGDHGSSSSSSHATIRPSSHDPSQGGVAGSTLGSHPQELSTHDSVPRQI